MTIKRFFKRKKSEAPLAPLAPLEAPLEAPPLEAQPLEVQSTSASSAPPSPPPAKTDNLDFFNDDENCELSFLVAERLRAVANDNVIPLEVRQFVLKYIESHGGGVVEISPFEPDLQKLTVIKPVVPEVSFTMQTAPTAAPTAAPTTAPAIAPTKQPQEPINMAPNEQQPAPQTSHQSVQCMPPPPLPESMQFAPPVSAPIAQSHYSVHTQLHTAPRGPLQSDPTHTYTSKHRPPQQQRVQSTAPRNNSISSQKLSESELDWPFYLHQEFTDADEMPPAPPFQPYKVDSLRKYVRNNSISTSSATSEAPSLTYTSHSSISESSVSTAASLNNKSRTTLQSSPQRHTKVVDLNGWRKTRVMAGLPCFDLNNPNAMCGARDMSGPYPCIPNRRSVRDGKFKRQSVLMPVSYAFEGE